MPAWSLREWTEEEVAWGETACHLHQDLHPAQALLDGLPICLDGAEEWLERLAAIEERPELREHLPPVGT